MPALKTVSASKKMSRRDAQPVRLYIQPMRLYKRQTCYPSPIPMFHHYKHVEIDPSIE
jgi:hypothetical protein